MKQLAMWIGAAALAFGAAGAASVAVAGEMPMEHAMGHEDAAAHSEAMGDHWMPARVTKVDHKSGLVHVVSEGMHLVVHFPPPAVEDLKTGEKINLHLGYSKE